MLNDPKFKELQAFFSEMKEKGVVEKPEYSVPNPDTIGYWLFR